MVRLKWVLRPDCFPTQNSVKLPVAVQQLHSRLSEIGYVSEFCHYDLVSEHEDALKIYYFSQADHLSSDIFLNHIRQCNASASLALLDFPVQGVCQKSAVYFKDLILLEDSLQTNAERIEQSIRVLREPKDATMNQRVMETFYRLSFVGRSQAYQAVVAKVNKMVACRAPVLIEGETGTGKELLARALHYLSPEKSRGFVPVNCAAIPDSLFESELFGHEKGAFTHAQKKHIGLIELAEGGTLFLDEVDSLSEKAQTALLRFLQTGEFRALGSTHFKKADVRVVSATNTPLLHAVKKRGFREDLYFRLNVLQLQVPPLRERVGDIELIAQHLLQRFEIRYCQGKKLLHPDLLLWLKRQEWIGNVRELENNLLRRYLLSDTTVIGLSDDEKCGAHSSQDESKDDLVSSPIVVEELSYQEAKKYAIDHFTQQYISSVLEITSGNITQAAALAGKERRAFGRLIKKYQLNVDRYR